MTILPWAVRKRLTPTEINDLVTAFQTGARQKDLADKYAISLYSVKQLLKNAGVRRYRIRASDGNIQASGASDRAGGKMDTHPMTSPMLKSVSGGRPV